ncbi:MAG: hypothetical protein H6Q32_247, partial [Bacteroidetes bacterium]|nr:hypothetical protein [Bacteroidota bacterium]
MASPVDLPRTCAVSLVSPAAYTRTESLFALTRIVSPVAYTRTVSLFALTRIVS